MPDALQIHGVPGMEPGKRSLMDRIRQLSPWKFVIVASSILVVTNLVQFLILLVLADYYSLPLPKGDAVAKLKEMYGPEGLFCCGVLAIPWFETLLGQALPMALIAPVWSFCKQFLPRPATSYILLATVWFSLLHGLGLDSGRWLYILLHVAGSFILACTFLHGWKHSWWRGIWMTSIVHAAANLLAFFYEMYRGS